MATVELSRIKVFTRHAVCIEFATSSRQLLTDLVENLETEHVENLSCRVELCRWCVHTRRLSQPSLQFCSHRPWLTTADGCVHTADTTQLDFVVGKFVQTRRDCRQLNTHCRRDSTQQLRCVGSVYWVLAVAIHFGAKRLVR